MASLTVWLKDNWFSLLQGVGIVGGLLFTALSVRRDTRARRTTDLLALAEQHRNLWGELHRRPELRRILQNDVDLVAVPVSPSEEEFLNVVFVHFYTGWLLASEGAIALMPMEALAADVRHFFKLPIPRAIWTQTKEERDKNFVRFVGESMTKKE